MSLKPGVPSGPSGHPVPPSQAQDRGGWLGYEWGWRGTGRDPRRSVMLLAGNEESRSPPPHQEAKNIKKDGNIKNLSCKEKHFSFHEGNEIRGNCETRRLNQT